MFIQSIQSRVTFKTMLNYIEVLKPRETVLLTFIGFCAAVIASGGQPPIDILLLATLAILLGSSGANGITNYLDREVDARMQRVSHRPLPSKRIFPAWKMLPLAIGLSVGALIIAWFLHPLCFLFGLLGITAASTWRKRITCAFPQGAVAGCSPVLIGYVAISHQLDLTILLLCILITLWTPLHVWSVMIANREDYRQAGITYFPISWEVKDAIKVLLLLAVLLLGSSISLYYFSDSGLGMPYLVAASILGTLTVFTTARLVLTGISHDAWRVYKLTAFPFLGILFLTMVLDLWLL
ncbi:MAG TPA: UbiA family prenyltransferase [Dehalococcoidia bacterium]|nr:UbiA family prenyltransferase [Dehalococcoidia bacterium]